MNVVDIDSLYRELMVAVVIQAIWDYTDYRWKAEHAAHIQGRNFAAKQVEELEEFFLSDRLVLYTDMNGRELLRIIKRMPARQSKRGRGSNRYVW